MKRLEKQPLHIGMPVHFVEELSDGRRVCRAAIITEIRDGAPGNVGLTVLGTTQRHGRSLMEGGHDQDEPLFQNGVMDGMPARQTWHRVHPYEG